MSILPFQLDTNEITITKATSNDSVTVKQLKNTESSATIGESILTPPSSQITITATTTTTPINSKTAPAEVTMNTTVIEDDDDDVIMEITNAGATSLGSTPSNAIATSGLKSVSTTIK